MTDLQLIYKRLRNYFAQKPTKFPSYLAWLRKQRCVKCGKSGVEAHHVFGSYGPHKTSDLATIPVCHSCHEVLQDSSEAIEYLIITLARAIKYGRK